MQKTRKICDSLRIQLLGFQSVFQYNIRKFVYLDFMVSIIITIFLAKKYRFLSDTLFIIKVFVFGNKILKFERLLPVNNLFIKINESKVRQITFYRNSVSALYFLIIFVVDFFILVEFRLIKSAANFWLISIVLLFHTWIVSYIFQRSDIWRRGSYELISLFQYISLGVSMILLYACLHLIGMHNFSLVISLLAIGQAIFLYFLHNSLSSFKAYRRKDD